jgi:hypothetical protein
MVNNLLKLIWPSGLGVLDTIVTINESAVSLHTLETNQ